MRGRWKGSGGGGVDVWVEVVMRTGRTSKAEEYEG